MGAAENHSEKIAKIQEQMRSLLRGRLGPISLEYRSHPSNTTRSKSYKKGSQKLELGSLNEIVEIDPDKRIAIVEPRVTMQELVKATLEVGLIPPVVPEFKGITVGGAIMGGAAESSSHRFGGFNDICLSFEILCGDAGVIRASPDENADLFYGISCSYGSIGTLLSVELELIPAKKCARLRYHSCASPSEAIEKLQTLTHGNDPPDFLDAIIFSKESAVVIEGSLAETNSLPHFSLKPLHSKWYYQHVEDLSPPHEETMPLEDYLFRYDQGAFWLGGFLLRPQFLTRYLIQGILKKAKRFQEIFTKENIKKLHSPPRPNVFWRTLLYPFFSTKCLWQMFHQADKWIQNNALLQDFCIPEENAKLFLEEVISETGTFPLWLCPIKSTSKPQIFAPHFIKDKTSCHVMNIGIYGLPSHYTSVEKLTKKLEELAQKHGGKKVFYSRSFYTEEEFWKLYSREAYQALRKKTSTEGVFHEITEKILSE